MGAPKKTTRKTSNDDMSLNVRKHGEKRVRKLVHQSPSTTVGSLPKDLLVDVLGRVASSSFNDLFNAKLSCKDFLESTANDYISQHISIEKYPIPNWSRNERVISFLNHCFNKGNPESLFRQGTIDYFELGKVESGLTYLKRAVEKGHSEATYLYGMILLSTGHDQQGLKLLNSMNHPRSRCSNVRACRDKVGSILGRIWNTNKVTLTKVDTKCREGDHAIRFERRGWRFDEDEEIASCDVCLWYRELVYYCKSQNVIV